MYLQKKAHVCTNRCADAIILWRGAQASIVTPGWELRFGKIGSFFKLGRSTAAFPSTAPSATHVGSADIGARTVISLIVCTAMQSCG